MWNEERTTYTHNSNTEWIKLADATVKNATHGEKHTDNNTKIEQQSKAQRARFGIIINIYFYIIIQLLGYYCITGRLLFLNIHIKRQNACSSFIAGANI